MNSNRYRIRQVHGSGISKAFPIGGLRFSTGLNVIRGSAALGNQLEDILRWVMYGKCQDPTNFETTADILVEWEQVHAQLNLPNQVFHLRRRGRTLGSSQLFLGDEPISAASLSQLLPPSIQNKMKVILIDKDSIFRASTALRARRWSLSHYSKARDARQSLKEAANKRFSIHGELQHAKVKLAELKLQLDTEMMTLHAKEVMNRIHRLRTSKWIENVVQMRTEFQQADVSEFVRSSEALEQSLHALGLLRDIPYDMLTSVPSALQIQEQLVDSLHSSLSHLGHSTEVLYVDSARIARFEFQRFVKNLSRLSRSLFTDSIASARMEHPQRPLESKISIYIMKQGETPQSWHSLSAPERFKLSWLVTLAASKLTSLPIAMTNLGLQGNNLISDVEIERVLSAIALERQVLFFRSQEL